jgi:cyclic pyranopterin phosphate synthase
LKRITVSLDGLDDTIFQAMNDVDFPVAEVLGGIAVAKSVGLGPIKVNMVVKRGTNDAEILPMAQHFKGSGITLRFIEYMDVGSSNGWRMNDVVPSAELVERIRKQHPIVALEAAKPGETAQRWGYANAQGMHDLEAGEFGVISSVTQAFCGDCNRVRLSTEGKLYLCLFASHGHDLRQLMRNTCTDQALSTAIAHIWQSRTDRYSAMRGSQQSTPADASAPKIEMSYIGG